jgi:hypothetical protein
MASAPSLAVTTAAGTPGGGHDRNTPETHTTEGTLLTQPRLTGEADLNTRDLLPDGEIRP